MEPEELLTAVQMLSITESKSLSLNECMREIRINANTGTSEMLTFKKVTYTVQTELMLLGYSISIVKDNLGLSAIKISW